MGFKRAGIKAFNSYGNLFVYFNDYNYTLGSSPEHIWITKLYDQMLSMDEINMIAAKFRDEILERINIQLEDL